MTQRSEEALAETVNQVKDLISNFGAVRGLEKAARLSAILASVMQMERMNRVVTAMYRNSGAPENIVKAQTEHNASVCVDLLRAGLSDWTPELIKEGMQIAKISDKLIRGVDPWWNA